MAVVRRIRRAQVKAVQPALAIDCLDVEDELRDAGYACIAGVDEVGRGCWAGPVYAGAVVLPSECYADRGLLAEVTDSKMLTPLKRERLAERILHHAVAVSVGWAEAPTVDRLNVLGATRVAMCAAITALSSPVDGSLCATASGTGARRLRGEDVIPDFLLIDAVKLPESGLPQRAVIRGDSTCLAIAAASIVAKVTRDADMARRSAGFEPFDLARNKGYGSRRHADALRRHGVTPLHRRSFAPVKYYLGVKDHVAGALTG